MKKLLIVLMSTLLGSAAASARSSTVWHNEAEDTTRIANILTETYAMRYPSVSARTIAIAKQFIGTPYVAHTLEVEPEALVVNLDELDCTTFVDVVLALSYTVGERRMGWQDFEYNLRRMRYRSGEINGYASRLHYNCDWAMDNIHRGNIIDVTTLASKCFYQVRTIDYMSAHREDYPALADSLTFERVLSIENGYRNHRFPYIKVNDLGSKEVLSVLREGDVVAFVSARKDLDVTHLGFLVKENGKLHVLHASSTDGKVEVSNVPLQEFVKRNRHWIGIRVYRLKQ